MKQSSKPYGIAKPHIKRDDLDPDGNGWECVGRHRGLVCVGLGSSPWEAYQKMLLDRHHA